MTEAPAVIARLSALTHRYADTLALDRVDLKIPAGCTVGFIGPDGVGKSSLLALLAGVRKIQQGTVDVLGGDMRRNRHRSVVCPRIAYMPQGLGRNLYMTLSVYENIEFFARLFGQLREEREWRIRELLQSTGLTPFADRPAGKLSGGMKQKLGLCCALIHDPDLLILDEPTTGVDPLSRRQFWELVERLRARRVGMSVLVATAYMAEADRFDWLVAMDEGRILATGSPQELKFRSGEDDLDAAFIRLLPEHKRRGHTTLVVPAPTPKTDAVAAIRAQGLSKRFGDFTAVDHVSFEISRGEIFGFLGSNGCGKTTTMKMLTGLLPPTAGEAALFGHSVNARDLDTRRRVGYMSQSFSLYGELTVMQNLDLHARLFHMPAAQRSTRLTALIERFELGHYVDERSASLPLGIRQRLSLAVAVVHEPDMLILDEPTSGVDPVARDRFWELLIDLSRKQGVTIFISTHFMNEAERCDRISFMHAGKVLVSDTPQDLIASQGVANLEESFIAYLKASARENQQPAPVTDQAAVHPQSETATRSERFSLMRLLAYARREAMELMRDRIRLAFALLGPLILMVVFGYGISFDVENLAYAVLDQDQTPESRRYLEGFEGSRYFEQQAVIVDYADMERRLASGELVLAIDVPPNFGQDLKRDRRPQVAAWLDGAMPFRAETTRGYVQGVHLDYLTERVYNGEDGRQTQSQPFDIEHRYRYNQDFKSVFAMVPGVIMLLLMLIPAMMTAVGVVREKELGSITNLYATPVTRLEFVLGKQIPYILIALVSFATLVFMAFFLFGVPVKGSFVALAVGTLLYVVASTGFGLLISIFVKTQIAAIFAAAILTFMPTINFSGFLTPVSALSGGGRVVGYSFPSTYFQKISVGSFTKALEMGDLVAEYLALVAFIVVFLVLSLSLLKAQEA